jgi:hypothetical protein
LILASTSLLALSTRTTKRSICTRVITTGRKRKFNRNLIFPSQVCVRDLRIGNFEGGAILNIKCQLRLSKLAFAPVPSTKCMLLVFEIRAVPVLEDFA